MRNLSTFDKATHCISFMIPSGFFLFHPEKLAFEIETSYENEHILELDGTLDSEIRRECQIYGSIQLFISECIEHFLPFIEQMES